MIAIYVRVSSEEQAKKGYSIRNQIQQCKEKAKTNEVIEYVDEGYSGEYLERPAMGKLREDVRNGLVTKLVCYDPDRLSRKLMNALIIDDEFRKRGVEMIYVNGEFASTPEGQLFYSMRGAISEFEKAKINERMSSGRKRKAVEGKVVKNNYIYGYDYNKDKGKMIINESEAEIVRLIFDLFTKPDNGVKGINGIANLLTNRGVPTKKGKSVWHRQVVRQILMNETYLGTFYQNKWNTEGMLGNKYKESNDDKVRISLRDKADWIATEVPQIIENDQFYIAQDLIKHARQRWSNTTNRYLLSGLLRCDNCGNTVTGTYQNNWNKKIRIYTDIKNTAGAKTRGCGLRLKGDELEEQVWNTIDEFMRYPDKYIEYKPTEEATISKFELKQIDSLKEDIEKNRSGRKKLMQLFALEDIDTEEVKDSIVMLSEKEKELKEKLAELEGKQIVTATEYNSEDIYNSARELWLKNNEISWEDKQSILRMLIKEIKIIDKDNINISLF